MKKGKPEGNNNSKKWNSKKERWSGHGYSVECGHESVDSYTMITTQESADCSAALAHLLR